MSRRDNHYPYLVIFIAQSILFLPNLIAGKVLFWGAPILQFIPWWTFAAEMVFQGKFPFWNTYLGFGAPLLANYQLAFFYPPNWILLAGYWIGGTEGIATGFSILEYLHLIFAGVGWVKFLAYHRYNRLAQTIAGLAYCLSGYLIARNGFFSMIWVAAWYPWIFLLIDKAIDTIEKTWKEKFPAFLLASIAVSMQLLAGHAQLTWYCILLSSGWVLVDTFQRISWIRFCKVIISLLIIYLVATALSAIQLVPTLEYLLNSSRAGAFEYESAMTYSLWKWRLLTFIAPNFFGNPGTGNYWGYASFWEDAGYIGLIPLLLAISTVKRFFYTQRYQGMERLSKSRFLFAWGALTLGVILALGKFTPVFPWLYHNIPTFNMFQAPARFLLWTVFCFVLLSAEGVQTWQYPTSKWGVYWLRLGTAGCVSIVIGAFIMGQYLSGNRATFILPTVIAGIIAFLTGFLTLALRWTNREPHRLYWELIVVTLVIGDLVLANISTIPWSDRAIFNRNRFEVQDSSLQNSQRRVYIDSSLEYQQKFDRFFRFTSFIPRESWTNIYPTLLPNTNLFLKIKLANNFDPLIPARYLDLIHLIESTSFSEKVQLFRLIYVTDYWRKPQPGSGEIEQVQIANSHQWLWSSCPILVETGLGSLEKIREWLSKTSDDNFLVIETSNENIQNNCETTEEPVNVFSYTESSNRITIMIDTPQDGWLSINEAYYPGWKAYIDGKEVNVYQANYLFQAVAVHSGKHTVEFVYHSSKFLIGACITFTTILLLSVTFATIRKLIAK
ncbi:MAG TPA: YfhO family protein [Anaerolineaceae bacterium]